MARMSLFTNNPLRFGVLMVAMSFMAPESLAYTLRLFGGVSVGVGVFAAFFGREQDNATAQTPVREAFGQRSAGQGPSVTR